MDTNITWQPSHFSPWMKYLVVTSVLAVLYVVTARLGLLLALPPDVKVPAVWPPSGIALAGVLLLGYRVWPGIWLGAFLGNLWDFFQAPGQAPLSSHLLLSSGIAVGSTLQPLVGAYLINRLMGGQNPLDSAGNVFRFVMVSLLMCLVASTIGVTFFLSAGFTTWANLGFNWMTWWLGDLMGVLVVTPLVLTWHRLPDCLVAPRRLAEASLLLVILLGVGLLNFGVWGPEGIDNGYLLYMTVPPLVWAVLRFGQHGATAALLLVSGIAVWGTSQHHGPWAMQTLNESFMPLQTFLGVLTLTSLALVGVLTERQRGVAALQESTERLHLAQEAGHIGVWDWNVLTGQLHWDGVETIHGLEAGSFGGSFEDYLQDVHSQDRDVVIKAVNQAIEQGGELDQQYRVVWDDGSIHWVHSKGRAFQDEQGRTVRLAGTCQDITRRKESDEAKVASEERFRSLIEHSYDAIAVVDHEGVFAYASPSVRTILGFAPEELLGTNGFNLVHPDELPEARGAFAQILQAPDNRAEVRVRAHRADGSWPWLEVSIMNLLHHPAVDGVVVNFRDITERKQAEEQTREALRREMLLKEEIHHRVKNNLQVVNSLLYLESIRISDEATQEILRDCQSRIQAIALVHEKLYRSEDIARVNFADYAAELVMDLIRTYSVQKKELRVHTDIENVFLGVDTAVPCGLIINELVSNVFKHAFIGRTNGELWIKVRQHEDNTYTLTVRDNGAGLPEGFNLDTANSLGMNLVRDLTTQLDGALFVESGDGTTFHATFKDPVYRERW